MNVPSSYESEVPHRSVTTSDSEKNDDALATSRYQISDGLNDDESWMSSTKAWRPWTKMNATFRVEGELTRVVSSKYCWLLPPTIGITPATECSKYSWLFMKIHSATSSRNYYILWLALFRWWVEEVNNTSSSLRGSVHLQLYVAFILVQGRQAWKLDIRHSSSFRPSEIWNLLVARASSFFLLSLVVTDRCGTSDP